jgi:hypothetical protein
VTEPRQHHILPEFYLAGFTDTGTREGRLHVFDYVRNRRFRARPGQVARERDFYRLYEPGEDQNTVEYELARLEGELGSVLRHVTDTGKVHGSEELGALLSLVALVHARGPKVRQQLSLALEHTMGERLKAGVVSADQWERLVKAEMRAGVDPAILPEYDDTQRLIQQGHWSPRAIASPFVK